MWRRTSRHVSGRDGEAFCIGNASSVFSNKTSPPDQMCHLLTLAQAMRLHTVSATCRCQACPCVPSEEGGVSS